MLPSWTVIGSLTFRGLAQRRLLPWHISPCPPFYQIQDGGLICKCALTHPKYTCTAGYLNQCSDFYCVNSSSQCFAFAYPSPPPPPACCQVAQVIDQFRYIKIQPKTIDLSTRLWGITTEFVGFIPWSLVLRSIVLG